MKYLKSPENHTCKFNQSNIAIRQGCTIKSVWITHWCSQHPLLVQKLESITNCVIRSHLHNWSPQKKSKEKLFTLALSPRLSFKTWYICGTACLRTHMYAWTIFCSLGYQDEEEKKYLKTANFKGQEQNKINILHENWGARETLKLCKMKKMASRLQFMDEQASKKRIQRWSRIYLQHCRCQGQRIRGCDRRRLWELR